MSTYNIRKFSFSGSPPKQTQGAHTAPNVGAPCLYLLCDTNSKAPFYIGEYGKSAQYNVVERIRRHFAKTGTLARVSKNLLAFNYAVPRTFDAYIKQLSSDFENARNRESLEAWVIHLLCHERKGQDKKFCVTKHIAPRHNYAKDAQNIIDEFNRCS